MADDLQTGLFLFLAAYIKNLSGTGSSRSRVISQKVTNVQNVFGTWVEVYWHMGDSIWHMGDSIWHMGEIYGTCVARLAHG